MHCVPKNGMPQISYICDEPGQFPALRVPLPAIIWPSPFLAGYCRVAGWLDRSTTDIAPWVLTVERTLYKRQRARTSESGQAAESSKPIGPRRRPSRWPSRGPGWISRRSRVSRSNTEAKTGEVIESHRYSRGASTKCRGLDTYRRVEDGGTTPDSPSEPGKTSPFYPVSIHQGAW